MRMRVTTAMCRARFKRRSPPRLIRWRTVFPEEAGIGFTPARLANAASDRTRPGCDQAAGPPPVASGMAALMSPDLRERRPGQWRWRESNLAGGVGTSWLAALTCGNVQDVFGPDGSDCPELLTASTPRADLGIVSRSRLRKQPQSLDQPVRTPAPCPRCWSRLPRGGPVEPIDRQTFRRRAAANGSAIAALVRARRADPLKGRDRGRRARCIRGAQNSARPRPPLQ